MENKRTRWILITGSILLIVVIATGCGSSEKAQREATQQAQATWEEQVLKPVLPVCSGDGQAVAEAAAYSQMSGVHPVVLARGSVEGNWRAPRDPLRPEWTPQTLPEVELVACMQVAEVLVESCPYTLENGRQASVERLQYQTNITLREAKTGVVVADTVLAGAMPAECSSETRFERDELTKKVYGVAVGIGQVSAWLQPYVELP
ncbi:MAG: hypothetical protein JW953_10245 [Anaerolineae bacterium]|nr:hypothetical protein [Anaerolineae bacterium]